MGEPVTKGNTFMPIRPDWLARHQEEIIDPALPIVDAHHHAWIRNGVRYLLDDLLQDIRTGHNIVSTVFVEARAMYRDDGPEELRSLGEVEFVNGIAAAAASGICGSVRLCAGIVGFVDLRLGARAKPILELMMARCGGRFKGVRNLGSWDADPEVFLPRPDRAPHLLTDAKFREGFAQLAPLGLTYDSWLYYPQSPDLIALARAFPETTIIVDHCTGPIGVGTYSRRDEVFAQWKALTLELASCPNVYMKLGGLGMRQTGFGFYDRENPPSSGDLASAWAPYIETCIEAFGTRRSMFESNFPPDKGTCSYPVLWNAFKRLTAGCSATEKTDLFSGTATRVYRLD